MNKKNLSILSQSNHIAEVLCKQYITNLGLGYQVRIYNEYHPDIVDKKPLLIIEPFKIGEEYFTISRLWKNFFTIDFHLKKIILTGFSNFNSNNYMDLLDLPENIDGFIKNARSVNTDWDIPIDGLDLLERFKLFFKGHGAFSLLAKINQIYFSLNTAYVSILSKESSITKVLDTLIKPYMIPEWKDLILRWDRYTIFFKYTPFYPEMKAVDDVFKNISNILQSDDDGLNEDNFMSLKLDSKIKDVHFTLKDIDRKYIRPEIYNEA